MFCFSNEKAEIFRPLHEFLYYVLLRQYFTKKKMSGETCYQLHQKKLQSINDEAFDENYVEVKFVSN